MNGMMKIVIFMLCFNFAIGILAQVPGLDLTETPQNMGGLVYNESYGSDFDTTFRENPNIQNDVSGGWFNSVLDIVGLGFINRILEVIDQYLFGFISYLVKPIFGRFLTDGLSNVIFPSMYLAISILYVIGAIQLFTGKDLTSR